MKRKGQNLQEGLLSWPSLNCKHDSSFIMDLQILFLQSPPLLQLLLLNLHPTSNTISVVAAMIYINLAPA